MGNLAVRFSFSPMKETLRNWKISSTLWIRVATKARQWRDQIKCKTAQNLKNDRSKPIFPPEVVLEILSWLPLKTLSQVQLVCKEWRALITDHFFIEKHMDRAPVVLHWYNVTRNPANKPHHDSYSFIHGCDGLLLLRNNSSCKYCLWNPAARRVLELPDPHDGNHGFVICFVPATANYRVVAIYEDKACGCEGCEVLTPGRSTAWKPLKFPSVVDVSGRREIARVSVVPAGGAVHCVLVIKAGAETFEVVVSLDVGTELFTVDHLQKGVLTAWDLDWDGRLAFVEIVGEGLQVRGLEDFKNRWCEKKKVIPLPFLKDYGGGGNVIPLFAKQGDIWFWLKDERVFTYTIETGQVTDIKKSQTFSLPNKLYPYKPSLVTFEGMLPDTRLESLRPRLGFN